jgi:hypothetical protein
MPSASPHQAKTFGINNMKLKLMNRFPKNGAVGSIHLEFKRCGKPNCRCTNGLPHGPYMYRRWRENGRQRRQHIPMHKLAETLIAVECARAERETFACLKKELRDVD